MLFGREGECARIDHLLDDARTGRSGALLIRGEAGIGKTALLDRTVAAAGETRVLRAVGVEAEAGFDFAGLHALVLPLLDHLDEVPAIQSDALRGALGLAEPAGVGRLFVGAATLSLLAAAAAEGGLLCVVDDAHALDRASAVALAFAARRLGAEGVVMLFGARNDSPGAFLGGGLPALELRGLDGDAARQLLEERSSVAVPQSVAAELVAATGGNPLALVEVCRKLERKQLTGADPLPHPLPIGGDLLVAFARRADNLSEEARRALMIAAAADTSAMRVIAGAGGATRSALEECEDAGLLAIAGGTVGFSHPLVRHSVYQQASAAEKRLAHGAVAQAFEGDEQYATRQAWHAAVAAVEPDEDVAARLEGAAHSAGSRRGHVSAPTMFERAAALTPSPTARTRRLHLAARASWLAGDPTRARELLAPVVPDDPLVRADIAYLLGRISTVDAGPAPDLVEEASRVELADPVRAARLLALAAERAPDVGRPELAERAVALAGDEPTAALLANLALARALARRGDGDASTAALLRARALLVDGRAQDPELILAVVDAAVVVDAVDDFTRDVLATAIEAARGHAIVVLPRALVHSGWLSFASGRWADASVAFAEAQRLAHEIGRGVDHVAATAGRAILDALQGRDAEARATAAELPAATAERIVGLLALGAGAAEPAARHLTNSIHGDALLLHGLPPPELDLVEALIRGGEREEAVVVAARIETGDAARAWAAALLGETDAYAVAVAGLEPTPFLAARAQLNHGEALRRAGARREARVQLKAAREVFDRLGARPWNERAETELRATGETVRPRDPSAAETLTPQELLVARTVAAEATYKEAAAKLFLSPKTVEYHLHKVYRKLDLTSGRQLAARLAELELLE